MRMDNKKFYEFKNMGTDSLDIYVYGEIVSGGNDSKWDSTDVCFQDFQDALNNLGNTKNINMYINSVGGSITTTEGIVAMLQRVKDKGVKIDSYIDGLGASCASFLPMVSNNIYAYNSSLLMMHKPMGVAMGNADDFQTQIDILNKIEDSVMIPLYLSKAKDGIDEKQIKDMLSGNGKWLNAKEMNDIFNITILNENKDIAACLSINDRNILNKYKNIPEELKAKLQEKPKNNEDSEIKNKELELLKAKLQLQLI